jgi:ubiquinone/menaquinone biosynthesis C-methylase UbiE/uncharacterized protein YbaR (Trm112 family)
MDLALLGIFSCPDCTHSPLRIFPFDVSADEHCRQGALICPSCSSWYPIADSIPELLPEGREQPGLKARFFDGHRAELESLGIRRPGESRSPSVAEASAFEAQAHQRDHFDQLARRDDEFSYRSLGMLPFQRALRSLTFEAWRPRIRDGGLVLDIGCADGLSTFDVARPGLKAIGFDISREILADAVERADSQGLKNVTFFVGDADAMPVVAETIDCVLCYGTLHHVPDPARTLADAARVLRSGGIYLGVENNKTPLRPIFDLLMRVRPIWKEEAGAEAQMAPADLQRWTASSDLRMSARASVFLPPHVFNRFAPERAERLLRRTDKLFGRIPGLRQWGGLLLIEGIKASAPVTGGGR